MGSAAWHRYKEVHARELPRGQPSPWNPDADRIVPLLGHGTGRRDHMANRDVLAIGASVRGVEAFTFLAGCSSMNGTDSIGRRSLLACHDCGGVIRGSIRRMDRLAGAAEAPKAAHPTE